MAAPFTRLTLIERVYDGANGRPWRGLAITGDERFVLITADSPPGVQPGDDLIVSGRPQRADHDGLPDHLQLAPDQLAARVTAQLGEGMELRAFGTPAGTAPSRRPAAALTVLQPRLVSDDPVVAWVAGLGQGLNRLGPLALIDSSYNSRAEPGWYQSATDRLPLVGGLIDRLGVSRTRRLLEGALPAVYQGLLAGPELLSELMNGAGISHTGVARGPIMALAVPRAVLPFRRQATSAWYFHAMSGLPAGPYAPRRLPPLLDLRRLIAAHELAHAIEAEQTPTARENRAAQARAEGTADAFAVLAFARDFGITPVLQDLADWRRARMLVSGHEIHATAAVVEAAIRRAQEGLSGLDTAALLDEARRLAVAHQPDPDHVRELNSWNAILWGRGRARMERDGGFVGAAMEIELRQLLQDPPPYLPAEIETDLAGILAARERIAYGPAEISDPDVRAAAAKIYRQCLAESAADLAGDPPALRRMLADERARLLPDAADGFDWINRRWRVRDTAMGDHLAALDALAATAADAAPLPAPDRRPLILRPAAQPWHGHHAGFERTPEDALRLAVATLRDERDILKFGLPSDPGVAVDVPDALWRLRMVRQQAAFALRADPAAWARLSPRLTPAMQELVTGWATDAPQPDDPATRADRLAAVEQAFAVAQRQPDPASGPTSPPSPRTAHTNRGRQP